MHSSFAQRLLIFLELFKKNDIRKKYFLVGKNMVVRKNSRCGLRAVDVAEQRKLGLPWKTDAKIGLLGRS